ncbi:XRE family transcriptional regulator [Scopulibacillus darangshiensis]|uniref:XRE family transcriptional regulator n=1 Tax=Scopulibacillus darangshiensis TaxID=442528 RepID=A0A4V2SMM3_9BACL|nr:helix-turn-helix domain-containing protein [Scopulibacillus darangshiensis]TCP27836.1 XRE family transcriptional regulator [Scopulibacillus darangshiensis]
MRQARLNKELTQQELSDKCGFTKSLLSKIENGHISVALATLSKIAENLDLPLSWFLEEKEEKNLVIVPSNKRVIRGSSDEIGYSYETLANFSRFSPIEPTIVTIDPDLERTEPFTHKENEFIYILEGKINLNYDGSSFLLERDDSAYFKGGKPHIFLPANEEKAKILTILIQTQN